MMTMMIMINDSDDNDVGVDDNYNVGTLKSICQQENHDLLCVFNFNELFCRNFQFFVQYLDISIIELCRPIYSK